MTGLGLVVTGFVSSESLPAGNPERLINGMDYLGRICGYDQAVIDLPYAYYLPSGAPVCIDKCPEEDDFNTFHCRYDTTTEIANSAQDTVDSIGGNLDDIIMLKSMMAVPEYKCMPYVKTRLYLGFCVPDAAVQALAEATSAAIQVHTGENVSATFLDPATEDGFFDQLSADLGTSRGQIIGFGCGFAMVMGFLYLFFLRIPGVLCLMLWGIIEAIQCLFLGLGGYMYLTSEQWKTTPEGCSNVMGAQDEDGKYLSPCEHSDAEIAGVLYIGYFFLGIAACWFIFICCIRKRIQLAIGCVKEAAKAMAAMPIITIFPVLQTVGAVIFLIPWIVYMTYLASCGKVDPQCACPPSASGMGDFMGDMAGGAMDAMGVNQTEPEFEECEEGCIMYKSFTYSSDMKLAGLYMMFSWFWTSQFIIAMGQLVVAMSVSMWYFTKDKSTVGNKTFFAAAKKAMWYHMGTAAFGSLIIAIIKTIRVIVAYLQHEANKSKSKLAKAVLCAIQCCMWCLEKCMKFLNKNAYIQTAIFGYSFCKAARKAFFLILRNILRIAAVALASNIVLVIGKLFIMVSTTFVAYSAMKDTIGGELHFLWWPVLLTCFVSYFTAEMFNEVFGMAISTILQCFVADEELYEPNDRFASGDLGAMIKKTQTEHEKLTGGAGAKVAPEEAGDKYKKQESGLDLP